MLEAYGWVLDDKFHVHWKTQMALFLIPAAIYGIMFFGRHFPKSEASEKGLSFGEMIKDVGILGGLVVCGLLVMFCQGILGLGNTSSLIIGAVLLIAVGAITKGAIGHWMLFMLFVVHALVGAVELGTDNWIQNITGNILTSEQGKWLFVFTSLTMFALRFCANFIEKRIGLSPLGILLTCAILACVGLNLTSGIATFGGAMLALTVYAVGKTFFWPTMLAVASDRFPHRRGGDFDHGRNRMMSAGLIGAPGLGYAKDRFAGEALKTADAAVYEQYKAGAPSKFLPFVFDEAIGLDGKKLGDVQTKLNGVRAELAKTGNTDPKAAMDKLTAQERTVHESSIAGDRKTLVADSFVPAIMAGFYLLLLLYFKGIGGHNPVHIGEAEGKAK